MTLDATYRRPLHGGPDSPQVTLTVSGFTAPVGWEQTRGRELLQMAVAALRIPTKGRRQPLDQDVRVEVTPEARAEDVSR